MMKKAYEVPELDILRLDVQDAIANLSTAIGAGLFGGEGVEEW